MMVVMLTMLPVTMLLMAMCSEHCVSTKTPVLPGDLEVCICFEDAVLRTNLDVHGDKP